MRRVFIDVETTGFSSGEEDEILQIGICNGNGRKLFDQKYKPKKKRKWHVAERINKIKPEDVANEKTAEEDVDRIQAIFDKVDEIGMYNAGFDKRFLYSIGLNIDESKVVDVLPKARAFFKDAGKTKDAKLTTISSYLGIRHKKHDALGDAKATAVINLFIDEEVAKGAAADVYDYSSKVESTHLSAAKGFNNDVVGCGTNAHKFSDDPKRPHYLRCSILLFLIVILGLFIYGINTVGVFEPIREYGTCVLSLFITVLLFAAVRAIRLGCARRIRWIVRSIIDFAIIVFIVFVIMMMPGLFEDAMQFYILTGLACCLLFMMLVRLHRNMGF